MPGLRLVLAGAAMGNGNRGIEALGRSVIDSVARESPHTVLSILDDGWGVRSVARDERPHVEMVGVRHSRRWHRPESWAQIRVAQALGSGTNPVARRFARADAVLDLSAGDSFTDLYGPSRLAAICAPKEAAVRAASPLVLLPQTYGPFRTVAGRRRAERLVRSAAVAYARDGWSFDRLLELAGPGADRARLHQGVDVAFAMRPRRPVNEVAERVAELAGNGAVGVNVSGLLRDEAGHDRFGLAGDYLDTMTQVVRGLIAREEHVLFVPHVHQAGGGGESDVAAINQVRERLTASERDRSIVLPPELDAAEFKWCISQLDWFVGSRMHATIAGLSTLTPTTAYAYSDKTLGVFRTCGMAEHVVDARMSGGHAAAESMLADFDGRAATRRALTAGAPPVVAAARHQLREVLDTIRHWRSGSMSAETIA